MPKAKLDYAFVSTADCEPGKKKTDWYDETVTGFVLECRSSVRIPVIVGAYSTRWWAPVPRDRGRSGG
jgi:hypothetical protein